VSVILQVFHLFPVFKSEFGKVRLFLRYLSNTEFHRSVVAEVLAQASRVDKFWWDDFWKFGEAITAHGLLSSWLADPNPSVQVGAVIVGGAAQVIPPETLADQLRHNPNPTVRGAAAWGLGKLAEQVCRAPLEKALSDRDKMVRTAAARALGQLGDPAALPALRQALRHADEDIRKTILRAIRMLKKGG
jgi:hypothetical protein